MEATVSMASLTPELLELICSYLGELDIARTIAVAVHSTLAAAALEQAGVHSTAVIQEHSLSWAARLPLAQHVVGVRELTPERGLRELTRLHERGLWRQLTQASLMQPQWHYQMDEPGPALRTLGLASLIQILQDETHWFADEEARYQAAAAWLRAFRWWPRPAGEAAAAIGAVRLARMPPCAQQRVLDDAAQWPEARAALLAQPSAPATGAWSFGFAVPLPSSAAAAEAAAAEVEAEEAAAEAENEDEEDEEDEDEDDGGVPPFRWGSVPFWVAGAYLHAEAGAYVVYGMHGAVNEVPEMEVGMSRNPNPNPNPKP